MYQHINTHKHQSLYVADMVAGKNRHSWYDVIIEHFPELNPISPPQTMSM